MAAESPVVPAVVGAWLVEGLLGEGGMATVYAVHDVARPDRVAALKMIRAENVSDPAFVDMFFDEIRSLRYVQHPNVVRLVDADALGRQPYLVMDRLDGPDLHDVLRRISIRELPRIDHAAAWIGARIASALDAAHRATDETGEPLRLVHRDVSPSNIVLDGDGEPKLIDFGLAKARGRRSKTNLGLVKGKTAYLAPERLFDENVDGRSDVFALGVTLWEVTLGQRLFKRPSLAATLEAIHRCVVPDPRSIVNGYPDHLSRVIRKALARDPKARFATAAEMGEALTECTSPSSEDDARALAMPHSSTY